tara:strand:- start:27861 stop:29429 length:1569 start_codon:yes stop_codon:yes gene_type:complete
MANIYFPKLPNPVSPMGLAASAAGQGLMQLGENYIKVTDRNAELEAEEIKRVALAEVNRLDTSFNQGMAIETMDLDKAKLAETKRGNLASEESNRINQERLNLNTQSEIEARKAATDQGWQSLDDAREKWDDQMDFKERELAMQKSRDRLTRDIAEKNWDQAEKELAFQKDKFGWIKEVDKLKIAQTDKSLTENKRQFDANIKIRKQELTITEERLALDTTSAEDRKELDKKRIKIQEELADLEDRRVTLSEETALQDELYQDIMTELEQDQAALAERGMEVKEGMLTIAKEELNLKQDEGKWKFTTNDTTGQYCAEYYPGGTDCKEYKTGVIKTEIVAINLKDPELKDIRVMQEDGTWLYGTPEGLKSEITQALEQIDVLLRSKNSVTGTEFTVQEAIEHAKKQVPEFDWDSLLMFFRQVRVEVGTPAAVESTEPVIPEDNSEESSSDASTDNAGSKNRSVAGNAGNRLFVESMGGTIDSNGNIVLPNNGLLEGAGNSLVDDAVEMQGSRGLRGRYITPSQ